HVPRRSLSGCPECPSAGHMTRIGRESDTQTTLGRDPVKVGYLVGSGRHAEAKQRVYRYFALASVCTIVLVVPLELFHRSVLGLFAESPGILALASTVLLVASIHEPGRNFNTVLIPALKGAGDVRFPVAMGMLSMWGSASPARGCSASACTGASPGSGSRWRS